MRGTLKKSKNSVSLFVTALFFLSVFLNYYPNLFKIIVYPIFREIKKQNNLITSKNFNVIESKNFKVFYKNSSIESINMILNNSEKSLNFLIHDFNYIPDSKIDIIIYPEYDEMANKIGLSKGSIAIGVYYSGVISILEPGKWIVKKDNEDEIFNKEGPILHELTHYVIDYLTNGNIPVWFTEGLALYEEYIINNVEWAKDKSFETYYSYEQLENKFYNLDETKAYKQSFIIVKYIEENYGKDSIQNIISKLKYGKSLDFAVKEVLDQDINEVFLQACS